MYTSAINTLRSLVALRKESVDRNDALPEIDALKLVALRKESVDRNSWAARARVAQYCVALRKESVDRNRYRSAAGCRWPSRSPQGERG